MNIYATSLPSHKHAEGPHRLHGCRSEFRQGRILIDN